MTLPPVPSSTETSRRHVWLGVALIALSVTVAYKNTFPSPFVFDDVASIPDNATLGGFLSALSPPSGGLTVSGRPFLNLTFAFNRAISGDAVWSYHALNISIHIFAALTLFGIVRRTFLQPTLLGRFAAHALPIGTATACLWALHPLQTESVTYLVQRAESLMGLLYLLTLYCFVRGAERSIHTLRWLTFSFGACLLGMATKEVMVSAPLIVLLYDRTFVADSFRAAWRARRNYYLALAVTWLLLAVLVLTTGNRAGSAGLGTGVSSFDYALTQCRALGCYLKLSLWPSPLVFDYGKELVHRFAEVWALALVATFLIAASAVAIWRKSPWGVPAAWFLAILAPSSSVVPVVSQTIAEHRMYLPLAAVVLLIVAGLFTWLGRRALLVCGAIAVIFGVLAWRRNEVYRSDVTLWRDAVAQRPNNARAHNNLGYALSQRKLWHESVEEFGEAVRLDPAYGEAYNNLGSDLTNLNRATEAVTVLSVALRLQPGYAAAHQNLGDALSRLGRYAEAVEHYRLALKLHLDLPETHAQLGHALVQLGQPLQAIAACEQALRLQPDSAAAHNDLGIAFAQTGRSSEALAHFERSAQLAPNLPDAHNNLGNLLLLSGGLDAAIEQYRVALSLQPNHAAAHNNLGEALARAGRTGEAIVEFGRALQIDPAYAAAQRNLERVRAKPAN